MTQPVSYDDLPRQTSTVERAITVLLMAGLAVVVPVAGVLGLLTSMASDPCGSSTACNTGQIAVGVVVSTVSVAVAFLVTLVWVIVRWRARRTTWWVPLAGLAIGAAGWAIGAAITFTAVG